MSCKCEIIDGKCQITSKPKVKNQNHVNIKRPAIILK